MQGAVPDQQVVQRRINRPRPRHHGDVGVRLGRQTAGKVGVAHDDPMVAPVQIDARVLHAQRCEEGGFEIISERLTAGLLDDRGGEIKGRIVVAHLGSWRELKPVKL